MAEAIVRKVEAFSRFLPVAARMNGELLNFEKIASDSQVPARTVREYYSVLEDTLVGHQLSPIRFEGKNSRKAAATSKFYFFDCGIVNSLLGRKYVSPKSPEFGNIFETWIFHELKTYADYNAHQRDFEILFWRSPTGAEVDFVINREIGIEVKATSSVTKAHAKGLQDLGDIMKLRRRIVVSQDSQKRKFENIEAIPWRAFVEELWSDKV